MAKSLHELPFRVQLIVFVALCGVTVAVAWQLLLAPAHAEIATKTAQLEAVQLDLTRATTVARTLPAFQHDVAKLEAALAQTTAVLPDEKDPQDVLRQLHDMASDARLSISSFAPKNMSTKPTYSEWPISLGLSGGYHDLGRFFGEVANLPLLISISDLQVNAAPDGGAKGSVKATCVATTYVFTQDTTMLPPAAPGKGAKGQ